MNIYIFSFIVSVFFLILTIRFLANRKMDFQYVIYWIVISVLLIVLSLNSKLLDKVAAAMGVYYAPALLFAAGLIFILAIIFFITLFVSDITKRVVRLTQEVGLIKNEISKLEKKLEEKNE